MARGSNEERKRFNKSIAKTLQRYEGACALMAEWDAYCSSAQASREDFKYLKELRNKATKFRQYLRNKGVILSEEASIES